MAREGIALNALRSVTAARQAQDKAALRERQQLERATLGRERGPFPTYEQWLATRDRDAAQEWRHRVRHPATIEGGTHEQPAVRDIRDFRARIDGLRVSYFGEGARDRPAFTDNGRRIEIFNSRDRTSVLAALQLSAQKWRTFVVTGDERYKQLCVQLAAEHGFKIANPELAAAIAAERERLRQVRLSEKRAHGIEHRPRTPTPEAIYGRHLAEVSGQYRGKAVDPSRLDAQVAVRLAVTGHSPEQIAETIKNGARRARPGEHRDWDAYGRRAAEFAFSPPGRELQERLADRQQHSSAWKGGKTRTPCSAGSVVRSGTCEWSVQADSTEGSAASRSVSAAKRWPSCDTYLRASGSRTPTPPLLRGSAPPRVVVEFQVRAAVRDCPRLLRAGVEWWSVCTEELRRRPVH